METFFWILMLLALFSTSKATTTTRICKFAYGVDYIGQDLDVIKNVPFMTECCKKCQEMEKCKVFVWHPIPQNRLGLKYDRHDCHLKTGFLNPVWYPGPFAGYSTGNGPTMIQSSKITNYGTYGNFEFCPMGMLVIGFQLKTQAPQGTGDDTALNAIKLYCATPGWKFPTANYITSKQGIYGNWGSNFICSDGLMTAFRLRSEPPRGPGFDDTGANNMQMRCNAVDPHKELLTGDGLDAGNWQVMQQCLPGKAFCATRTQVEDNQGSQQTTVDNTSLNNVQMMCCDVIDYTCRAEDKWEEVSKCNNFGNSQTKTCTSQPTVGFHWPKSSFAGKHWVWTNAEKLGVSMTVAAQGFATSVSREPIRTKTTGYNWSNVYSPAWFRPNIMNVFVHAPPQTSVCLCQAVAMCDGMVVSRAPHFKTALRC